MIKVSLGSDTEGTSRRCAFQAQGRRGTKAQRPYEQHEVLSLLLESESSLLDIRSGVCEPAEGQAMPAGVGGDVCHILWGAQVSAANLPDSSCCPLSGSLST